MNSAWPKLEVAETEKQITVSAEIPGMEEKDVELLLNDGNFILRGEMKSETEDKKRQFSERFYGRFVQERHSQGRFAKDRASADEGKTDRHQQPNQTLRLDRLEMDGSRRAAGEGGRRYVRDHEYCCQRTQLKVAHVVGTCLGVACFMLDARAPR